LIRFSGYEKVVDLSRGMVWYTDYFPEVGYEVVLEFSGVRRHVVLVVQAVIVGCKDTLGPGSLRVFGDQPGIKLVAVPENGVLISSCAVLVPGLLEFAGCASSLRMYFLPYVFDGLQQLVERRLEFLYGFFLQAGGDGSHIDAGLL